MTAQQPLALHPEAPTEGLTLDGPYPLLGFVDLDGTRRTVLRCKGGRLGASTEQGRFYIDVRRRLLEYPDSARRLIEERRQWLAQPETERAALCEMSRAAFQAQQVERFRARREELAAKAERRRG